MIGALSLTWLRAVRPLISVYRGQRARARRMCDGAQVHPLVDTFCLPHAAASANAKCSCGARGRSRTDTLLRAVDFLITSAFAALSALSLRFVVWSTPSPWPCGFRCPPSALYTFPGMTFRGLARHQLERLRFRAFTEFDGLHPGDFSPGAQVVVSESAASTNSATRATRASFPQPPAGTGGSIGPG
jgi:transposase